MTVAALPSSIVYAEDGVTSSFAAPFRFKNPVNLAVERMTEDGALSTLSYGVDFTATPAPTDAGGTVTVAVASAGTKLRIRRQTPRAQDAQYTTGDRFPAATTSDAFDTAMLISQELGDAAGALQARAILAADGETGTVLPARAQLIGKLIGGNSVGDLIPFDAAVAGPVSDTIGNESGVAISQAVISLLLASDPRFFGYIGDGASHPLSSIKSFIGQNVANYTTEQWQALVPQVTALTNEVDGVAIQAMVNAAGVNRCCINLPAGSTALISFTIQSGAGDVFLNIDGANIQFVAGLSLGWAHGSAGTPANGRFYGRGRGEWLAGTSGLGSAYVNTFSTVAPQDYTTSVHDWVLRNFSFPAAKIVNATRGIDYKNVQPFGPDGTVQAGPGLAFEGHNANPGGFSFIIDNCEATNYAVAYQFDTYAIGALEGMQVIHSRGYTGQTLVKAYNHIFDAAHGYYQAPILCVTECDWQGTGPFLDLYGYTNVRSTNNYLVFEPNPRIVPPNPLYGYDLKACHDVISTGDNINVLSDVRNLEIWHTDSQTRNTLLERPTLNLQTTGDGSDHSYAPTIVQFDNNPAYPFSNVERDMVVEQAPPGVVYVNDVGGNQVSTTRGRVAAPESVYPTGTVSTDDYGQITYDDTFTGVTSAGGNIAITCPPTLFRSAKTWFATNGNAVQTTAAVSSRPGNNLGFMATFAGLGAGVPVTVNYRMTGK